MFHINATLGKSRLGAAYRLGCAISIITSLLGQSALPLPTSLAAPLAADQTTTAPTGGHLDWPALPNNQPNAAEEHVTATGTYQTSIPIPVPQAPGAPSLSLEYNSASGLGLAGVGWDLSVGSLTLIARDTRFGTPAWDYDSAWMWGNSPLVSTDSKGCGEQTGACSYRSAPDSLAQININLRSTIPTATITLPSGVILTYEPVLYDKPGYVGTYPAAPAGADTNVFAFLLKSIKTPNGYLTCFQNKHWGDKSWGRVAVLEKIIYGPELKDCATLPAPNLVHQVTFEYDDSTSTKSTSTKPSEHYFAPISYRYGAAVSFNNLLTSIEIYAADVTSTASKPVKQATYELVYESATDTETRLPRLKEVNLKTPASGTEKRTLRQFLYGDRDDVYDPDPNLLDLGLETKNFPPSLSGSITRPIRQPNSTGVFGTTTCRPIPDIFQSGFDQTDCAAPPSHGLTEQWSLMDINGDELIDIVVANEQGPDPTNPWKTYERDDTSNGFPLRDSKPLQQWAFINEGINNGTLVSTRVNLQTDAGSLTTDYDPMLPGASGKTNWIWLEGQGQTRAGMPVSISSPEIRNGGKCLSIDPRSDTRLWPFLPDGSFGGSQGSIGELVASTTYRPEVDNYNKYITSFTSIKDAFIPRHNVAATLSGWVDMDADGVPDWVVTPGMIQQFNIPSVAVCGGFAHQPNAPTIKLGPNSGQPYTAWYVASGDALLAQNSVQTFAAKEVEGPSGPMGLPLSFSIDSGQSDSLGLTIPIGSLVDTAIATATRGPLGLANSAPSLIANAVTPRGQSGISAGVSLSQPSPSAFNNLYQAVKNKEDLVNAAGNFLMSTAGINLDITVLQSASRGRSQSRAQIMDFNADGYPDYLLYDSVGIIDSTRQGDLVLYLNDGKGGFLPTQRVNAGYDYQSIANTNKVISDIEKEVVKATSNAEAAKTVWLPLCEAFLASHTPGSNPACVAVSASAVQAEDALEAAANLAAPFLKTSTDALPNDKAHPAEAIAIAKIFRDGVISPVFGAVPSYPGAICAGAQYATTLTVPPCFPFIEPSIVAENAMHAANTAELIYITMKQLGYQSRLNMLSKSVSHMDGGLVTNDIHGLSAQTQGLVDLNGDGLPDYVITQDAEKQKHCGDDTWEVFYGTGTSNLSVERGFQTSGSCFAVPPIAFDGSDPKTKDYTTIPIQMDYILQKGQALTSTETREKVYSYIALLDYNQDGRPDLIRAQGAWDPKLTINTWNVYLNNGLGFDLTHPLIVPSVRGSLPGVTGALNVNYPGLKSGYNLHPPLAGLQRSGSSVDAAFLDIDSDGTADIAQRVLHNPNQNGPIHAGILYWSRAGNAPQDLLVEERNPLTGSRFLVSYLPAPRFQWEDGVPDGNPPAGGHRTQMGGAAYLVSSVTFEPFLGRSTQKTSVGYDYKDPYYDTVDRAFTGFASLTVFPLDPATGAKLESGVTRVMLSAQSPNARGGETQVRLTEFGPKVPIAEILNSYTEVQTAANGPGPAISYFSERNQSISVEFPHDLTRAAVLDIGFDGHFPLANRANRAMASPSSSPGLEFNAELPTGGAAVFDASQSQWAELSLAPSELNLSQVTIEAWVNPSSMAAGGIIAQHPDGYELAVDSSGHITFGVKLSGVWALPVDGGTLPSGWSHVVASYDGIHIRIFVNTVEKAKVSRPGSINYPTAPTGAFRIGCAKDATGTDLCFNGELGELRIYPEAWKLPARITNTRAEYNETLGTPNFGMPIKMWSYGDLATQQDDVYEEISYAVPPLTGTQVQNAVAKSTIRALGANGSTLGEFLGYSELYYDGLALGKVSTGNLTKTAVYLGKIDSTVTTQPTADTITQLRYTDTNCPGVATESKDPLGAITTMTYDPTCAFLLTTTNALGHTVSHEYFGVNQVDYQVDYTDVKTKVKTKFGGFYGQVKSVTDANGGQTLSNYDEWGQIIATVGPYDTPQRPGAKIAYTDPVLSATELITPTLVAMSIWDDTQHKYRITYTFGDGQVQTEVVNQGKPDWLVSGIQDYDALGRVITVYKPRYLPTTATSTMEACPAAETWCDTQKLKQAKGDPLRDPAVVAHVQTAYDSRERVIRTYGPDVPWCADPSLLALSSGSLNLFCDDQNALATPVGHFTQFEYPAPGVTRMIDASGVTSIIRLDVQGRTKMVEEYVTTSSSPYAMSEYTYDRNGNVIAVKDINGNTTTAIYDALGRKTSSTDPDMGSWAYTYDQRGQLKTQTDARGGITVNDYDLLGRLTRTEYLQTTLSSMLKQYTFDGGSADTQSTDPVSTSTTPTTSALTWQIAPAIQPANHILMLHGLGKKPGVDSNVSFVVNLPNDPGAVAELSFRYNWFNSLCTKACSGESMTVEYQVSGTSTFETLASNTKLTSSLPDGSTSGSSNFADFTNAKTITAQFPASALGKRVTLFFKMHTAGTYTVPGGSINSTIELPIEVAWALDDISVYTKIPSVSEDIVERRYDTAELASAYKDAKPVLDLTFDLPDVVIDRSPVQNKVTTIGTGSDMGISGRALDLNSASSVEVPGTKFSSFGQNITVEAWINPTVTTSLQTLIKKEGTFELLRDSSGNLHCSIFSSGAWQHVVSSGRVPDADDTWTHVAMTYNGANLRCYINGAEDGSIPVSGQLGLTGDSLYVGSDAGSDLFTGLMDEVRVFSTARLPKDVLADALTPLRHGPPRGNILDLSFADPQSPWTDTSLANNHASPSQFKASLFPGIEGTAVDLEGVPGNIIVVPDAPSLNSEELTAETWVKTGTSADSLLIGKWDVNNFKPGWRLAINDLTGQVRFEVRTSVTTPDTWTTWSDTTSGKPSQGNSCSGTSNTSPTAQRVWVARATGPFTFSTVGGASWDTVIFVRDAAGNEIGCNNNTTTGRQSSLTINAVQGETYQIFQSGVNSSNNGPFTMTVSGPTVTGTALVTLDPINDNKWHHVAGVYDGKSLRVYIDGKLAIQTCREPEIPGSEGVPPTGGGEIPCQRPKVPDQRCIVDWERRDNIEYPNATCVKGSISNLLPVLIGAYGPSFIGLDGMEDEVRLSNYAKRDFEVAASARLYSAFTNALGYEVEMWNRTADDSYSYDLLGRLVTVQRNTTLQLPKAQPISSFYESRTAYDNFGRTSSLGYPDGEVVVSTYDRGGTEVNLTGYGDFIGSAVYGKQPYLLHADITSTGRIARLLFGNQVESVFTYDEGPIKSSTGSTNGTFGNELLSQQVTTLSNGKTLQDQNYEYDPLGNLLKRTDFPNPPLHGPLLSPPLLHTSPLTSTYMYDDLSRLTDFTTMLGTTVVASGDYTYDPLGNLLTKEGATLIYGVPSGTTNCGRVSATTLPHAVTQVTQAGNAKNYKQYCYDANGRLAETRVSGITESTFQHNIPGKIVQMTNAAGTFFFTYDGNGQRVHKVEPVKGAAPKVTSEPFGFYRVTSKGPEKYYFAAGRRIVRRIGPSPQDVFWYHPEHLGSTNLMTDADGAELQDAYSEYTPFGNALPNAANNKGLSPLPPPNTPNVTIDRSGGFQFTDKELDDSGLYYYDARYYDPTIGRFIEPDTVVPSVAPQALNRYSYVLNNPLKYTDPSGHDALPEIDHSLYQPPGFLYQGREEGIAASNNPNFTMWERSASFALTTLATPGAWLDEYFSTPIRNVPYYASLIGQYLARATLQSDAGDSFVDVLYAISNFSSGFNAAASVVAPFSAKSTSSIVSAKAEAGSTTFYTVQDAVDAARLRGSGTPWPASIERAALGEGVYAWGSRAEAATYLGRSGVLTLDLEIVTFEVNNARLSAFRRLSVDSLAGPQTWMQRYSRLWGGTADHGLEYVQRQSQFGQEHFFSSSVFGDLMFP